MSEGQKSQISLALEYIGRYSALVAFSIVFAVFIALTPKIMSPYNLLIILHQVTVFAILGAGMTPVIITGRIDLSVGSTLALSSCILGLALIEWKLGLIAALILAVLTGLAVGLLNGLLIAKLKVPFFLTTVGTMYAVRGLALILMGGVAKSLRDFPQLRYLSAGWIYVIPLPLILIIVTYILMDILLNNTPMGRYIYAIGSSFDAAKLVGISIDKYIILAYALSGLTAGIAGVYMSSRVMAASPIIGALYELYAIAAVALGGTSLFGGEGSVRGTLIGSLTLTIISNGCHLLGISPYLEYVVVGLVIVSMVALDVRIRYLRGEYIEKA